MRIPWWHGLIFFLLLAAAILPHVLSPFLLRLAILILFWAYLGQCWNILSGYAGQFSFGHAAYFGLGAYTSTLLLVNQGLNPWLGMIAGGFVAMVGGLSIGFLCFRYSVRGVYFALATLAFAEILRLIAMNAAFVRKSMGIQIPLRGGDSWIHFQFETTNIPYYYIILGMVISSIIIVRLIERDKLGYYFRAIHQNEEAAAALGVNLLRYKMAAMAMSCFMTGMGGTFYSQYFFFIDPDLVFGPEVSIEMLLRPILGGVGVLWGPLVGAVVLTPLSEVTRGLIRNPPAFLPFLLSLKGRSGVDIMLYGIIVIIVIIFMQHGLVGMLRAKKRKWAREGRATE